MEPNCDCPFNDVGVGMESQMIRPLLLLLFLTIANPIVGQEPASAFSRVRGFEGRQCVSYHHPRRPDLVRGKPQL